MDNAVLRRSLFVCALGCFIDIFDIQLFAVLRIPSLTDLGVAPDKITTLGGYILNAQMLGMICGAFLWGWLGDQFGRIKALYGSILIYSLGTLVCSFVYDPTSYGLARFVTGFGLAGETGAAIALVAEMMPALKRIWGIIIVASLGHLGPVAAILVSYLFPWRQTYMIAGFLGFAILILRLRLGESDLFKNAVQKNVLRGSLKLFCQKRQAITAIFCIMLGLPLVYAWFCLNFFSEEISRAVLLPHEIFNQKVCMICFYSGTALGDIIVGTTSQHWKSRRKVFTSFLIFGGLVSLGLLFVGAWVGISAHLFYALYVMIGIAGGTWALMNTVFSENFGTNIRATSAIVLSNFVRASAIPAVFAFQSMREITNITNAAIFVGIFVYTMGFWAVRHLRETHGIDLDYVETLGLGKV